MLGLGGAELLFIAGLLVLLFIVPKQLPKLFRGFGEAVREVKNISKVVNKTKEEVRADINEVKKTLT